MKKFKLFSTKGMCEIPRRGECFRIGWHIGACVLSTRWFVVMNTKRRYTM